MNGLFDHLDAEQRQHADRLPPDAPLADRLRPKVLADVVGQDHLIGADGPLGRMQASGRFSSMILWGPPGCGKTSLARVLAQETELYFEPLSAVFSGVADLKRVFQNAQSRRHMGRGTLLFVDEIHRFNRSQQDGFLPYVENGTVTLVGATTENPSFELNAALLSRCQVMTLKSLTHTALGQIQARAEEYYNRPLPLTAAASVALKNMADGDGRFYLNLLEDVFSLPQPQTPFDTDVLAQVVQKKMPVYDKDRDGHYNLISALHKALRGSDPDAALYWMCRMLDGGEDPGYILRRLTRFAVEDIGLADPQALDQAIAAWDAYDRLGAPEGHLAIAQLVLYLGTAPKSNGAYVAFKAAMRDAKAFGSLMPPKHSMNAPTKLMQQEGYGEGYVYDHDTEDGFAGLNYFPDDMPRQQYYAPPARGFERELNKRLEYWAKRRKV